MKIETLKDLVKVLTEAREASVNASQEKLKTLNDWYPCGFAWVYLIHYKGKSIDARSKIGKLLKELDIIKPPGGCIQIWDLGLRSQSMYAGEAGAEAAAKVFEKYGFSALVGSRID